MSLKSFLQRLRKRIFGRRALKPGASTGKLRVTRLEERKLLDASAGFMGGVLTLDAFNLNDALSIADNAGALDFQLTGGNIWDAPVGPGLSLVNPSTLRLSAAEVGNLNDLRINPTSGNDLASVSAGAALSLTSLEVADGGMITATAAGNDFDSVSLDGASVTLTDVDDISIDTLTTTSDVSISGTDITDGAGATISVGGNASFSGTTITLGDNVGDNVDFGSLTFSATGSASITEDSATVIAGTNSAASLSLTSDGALSNAAASSLTVVGDADLDATSIDLNDDGGRTVNFGSVQFSAVGNVTLDENSSVHISAGSSGNDVTINAGGNLTVATGASVSGDDISLVANESASDQGSIGTAADPFKVDGTSLETFSNGDQDLAAVGNITSFDFDSIDNSALLDPSGGNGTITLHSGDFRLDAPHSIVGTLEVAAGASISGTGQLNNLNIADGSTLDVSIGGLTADVDYDELNVSGSVTLAGSLNVSLNAFTPAAGNTFQIIDNDAADAVIGKFDGLAEGDILVTGAQAFSISYVGGDGNDVVLTALGNAGAFVTVNSGTLVLTGQGSHADSLTLSDDGTEITIEDTSGNVVTTDIAGATRVSNSKIRIARAAFAGAVEVNGGDGADSLTIDLDSGNFAATITFHGNNPTSGSGDSLTLTGGGTFSTVTHAASSASDGTVAISGNGLISYTGLEPVVDNLDADHRVFQFTGAAETITLSDDAGFGDNESLIDSTLSESITFVNPNISLTIETSTGGGSGTDTVNVQGLDSLFAADLRVFADADDAIVFQTNATSTGGGHLVADAGTVALSEAIATSGGDVLIESGAALAIQNAINAGTGSVRLSAAGSITQLAAGIITAVELGVAQTSAGAGNVQLNAENVVNIVAATNAFTGGIVSIHSAGSIQVNGIAGQTIGTATFGAVGGISGGDIALSTTAGDVSLFANVVAGADIVLSAGGSENTLRLFGGVAIDTTGTNEEIILSADNMTFSSSGSIGSGGDTVVLRTTTAGHAIGLGAGATEAANKLTLDNFDLDALDSVGELHIGNNNSGTPNSGVITLEGDTELSSDIQLGAQSDAAELWLHSGAGVSGSGDIVTGSLAVISGGAVSLSGLNVNTVSTQAAGTVSLTQTSLGGNLAVGTVVADADLGIVPSAPAGVSGTEVLVHVLNGNLTINDSLAATGTVRLTVAAGIVDGNGAAVDITGAAASLSAVTGIGAGGALETSVGTIAASNVNSGNIAITNSVGSLLTIGNVFGVSGISNTAIGGTVNVTNASPLAITTSVFSHGDVTLTATDSLGSGDDLTVSNGAAVQSAAGDVRLQAGDNIAVAMGTTVNAGGVAGRVILKSDFNDADPGTGTSITFFGQLIAGMGASITGSTVDGDVIHFNPDGGSSGDVTLSGEGGNDSYTVQLGQLGGSVQIDDDAAEGSDSLTLNATTAADTLTISETQTTLTSPSETVTYSGNLESITLNGLAGEDTFHISPSLTAAFSIFGGSPVSPSSPGDTLSFTTPAGESQAFTQSGPDGGTVATTGGFLDVDFDEIETLNLVVDDLIVSGTGDVDLLEVTATNANSGSWRLVSNGVAGTTVTFAAINSLTFNAGDDADVLRINHPGGGVFSPAGGIVFNGQNGADSLELLGGTAIDIEHRYTNNSDGFVFYNGSGTANISYTGLAPVIDTTAGTNRTFTFTGASETITLSDDAVFGDNMSLIDSTLGESTTFMTPTGTVTINTEQSGGSGTDSVNIQGVDSAWSGNLTIAAGTADTVTFQTNTTDLGNGHLTVTSTGINILADIRTDGAVSSGDVQFNGAVVLGANVEIDMDGPGTDGTATFNGTVNSDIGQTRSLTVRGGAVTTSAVGATDSLSALLVTGDVSLGGNITASGSITLGTTTADDVELTGNVLLTAGDLVDISGGISGAFSVAFAATNGSDVDETIGTDVVNVVVSTGNLVAGAVDITGNLTTSAGLQLETDTGGISVGGNLNSGSTLTAETGVSIAGTSTLGGHVVAENGDITFSDTVTLNTDVQVNSSANGGDILFSSTTSTGGNNLQVNAGAAGNITLSGNLSGGGNLVVTDGDVQNYAGLSVASIDILDASTSVTFHGTVVVTANNASGGNALKVNTPGNVALATITATSAANLNVNIDPANVGVNSDISATGSIGITATNNITVSAGVTVRADSDGIGGGILSITADDANDVDGAGDLTAATSSTLRGHTVTLDGFNTTVGVVTADAGNAAITATNETTINGVVTATTGQVVVTATFDNVNINADLAAGTSAIIAATAGTIAHAAGANIVAGTSVTLDAGASIDIDGTIGAATAIGTDVAIGTIIDSANVTIDGHISADGAVTIGGPDLTGSVQVGATVAVTVITADVDSSGAEQLAIRADGSITQADGGSLRSNSGNVMIQSDAGNVAIGGVTATAGSVSITALSGSINDSANDSNVDVTAATLDLNAASGIGTAGAIDVTASTVNADTTTGNIDLDSLATSAVNVASLTTGGGAVRFDQTGNQALALTLVSSGNGDIHVTNAGGLAASVSVASVTADTIDDTVSITTSADIIDADADVDITAANLALRSATGIGSSGAFSALETQVTNLAFDNTASNDINISNTGALTISAVDGLTESRNLAGDVTLRATSPITFAVDTTAAGTLTAQALESAAVNFDNITVNPGVTVESTGGDVIFAAGDRISVSATATVRAAAAGVGDVTFQSGFGDTDLDGSIALGGEVIANSTDGVIRLNLNGQQGAVQLAAGTLNSRHLELLSSGANGSFDLDQSTTNTVATIAADVGGTVSYRDMDALEVGTAGATTGITTSSDNVTLCASTLTLAAGLAIGTGTLRIQAASGNINQTGGVVTASAVGGRATNGIALVQAGNDVDVVALNGGTGAVTIVDADGYTLGTVTANGCFASDVTGITTSGDFESCVTTGDIGINAALNVAGATVRLQADTGNITQSASGVITAANLGVRAFANIDLDQATNQISAVFAAVSTSAGAIAFTDGGGFTVGTVTAGTCFTPVVTGVSTASGGINLSADSGNLVNSDGITAGGAGNIELSTTTAGSVALTGTTTAAGDMLTVTSAQSINGAGLVTASSVDIDATSGIGDGTALELADVTSLAADNAGAGAVDINHAASASLDISSLTTSSGTISFAQLGNESLTLSAVSTGNGNVAITNNGGTAASLLIGSISADTVNDTVNLASGGSITDGSISELPNITASRASLTAVTGVGTDADDVDTALSVIAAVTESGDINVANSDSLEIGTVGLLSGLTISDTAADDSTSDNITIETSGTLVVSATATVTNNDGGNVDFSASNGIVDAGTVLLFDDVTVTGGDSAADMDGNIHIDAAAAVLVGAGVSLSTDDAGSAVDAGAISVDAGGPVSLRVGASVTTDDGDITINGNVGGTFSGAFDGVEINETTVRSDSGNIALTGTGGDDGSGNNDGIEISSSPGSLSLIQTTSGNITLDGTGGSGSNSEGVEIEGDTAAVTAIVTTATGAIDITGVGGASGSLNSGIDIDNGAVVESTGTGTITFHGTGGAVGNENRGIQIQDFSAVRSVNGNVLLTGIGGADGGLNAGIDVSNNSSVLSTGAATLTLDGTGGADGNETDGIFIHDTSAVTSTTGNIQLTGRGGAAGSFLATGVSLFDDGVVQSLGTATVTIVGFGGGATDASFGVLIQGADSSVTSVDGSIDIDGTGGGAAGGIDNTGVLILDGGAVSSTGIATISITGAGQFGSNDDGVVIDGSGSSVSSTGASIAITGTSNDAKGIEISDSGVVTSVDGNIELNGTGGTSGDAGIQLNSSSVRSVNGAIVIDGTSGTGQAVSLIAGSDVTGTGNASITMNGAGAIFMENGTTVTAANSQLVDLTATLDVTISAVSTVGGEVQVESTSGSIIDGGDAGVDITAAGASLRAVTGIGSSGAFGALDTILSNLAFHNSTSNNVGVRNTGSLTITAVDGLASSANLGGDVLLNATSPITFAVNTTAAGNLTAQALESGTTNFDNITVNAAVTVESTGGDVSFEAGDRINIAATATVQATSVGTGDVTFQSGFGDTDGDGAMTLHGSVTANATDGTITLNLNGQQGALQAGTGTLSAVGLRLLSTGATGLFDLDASSTNDVTTIAAAATGSVAYRDATALEVGTVTTAGIATSNDDVTLCATSITLARDIAIGTGTLRMHATTGSISQTGGAVTAMAIGARAAAGVSLNQTGNDIDTFAADGGSGSVTLVDSDGFTIGTVTASGCFAAAVSGITAGGDLESCVATGDIFITAALTVSDTIRLEATTGSVTQSSAGVINADNLGVRASGVIDLNAATGRNNIDSVFAAESTTAGSVELSDNGGFTVGTITAGTCFTPGVSGVTAANGSIDLLSDSGTLTNQDGITAGGPGNIVLATTTSGDAILTGTTTASGDTITVSSAAAINGGGLMKADAVDLDAASGIGHSTALNIAATTHAADTTSGNIDIDNALSTAVTVTSLTTGGGTITFDQSGGGEVTFNTVDSDNGDILLTATDGLNADSVTAGTAAVGDGDVTIRTTGGSVTADVVTADSDTVTISSADAIEERMTDAAADITADEIQLIAVNGIGTAAQLEVDGGTLAATTVSGDIRLQDTSGGIIVGDVTTGLGTTSGLSITAGIASDHLTLRSEGSIVVSSAVSHSGSGNVLLSAEAASSDIQAGASVTSVGGHVTIMAHRHIEMLAGVAVSTSGSGTIVVDAGADGGTTTGAFTMAADATLMTDAGDIHVDADEDITIGRVSTSADVALISATGSIVDADGDDTTTDVTAARLLANAAIGVGSLGLGTANAIETAVTTVSARAASGGINILERDGGSPDGITIDDVDAVTEKVNGDGSTATISDASQSDLITTAGNGAIVLRTAAGNIVLNDGTSPSNNSAVSAHGSGNVLVAAEGAGTDVTANADVTSSTGHITITAAQNVLIEDDVMTGGIGTVFVQAQAGSITLNDSPADADTTGISTSAGDILLNSATDTTLNADVTSGAGDIGIESGRDLLQNADVTMTSGSLSVDAVRDITMASGTSTSTSTGNILLNAGSSVRLGLLDAIGVSLNAVGSILDNNGGSTTNVRSTTLRMTAGDSIGAADGAAGNATNTNAIDTEIGTFAATAANGIWLNEVSAGVNLEISGVAAATVNVDVQQVSTDATTSAVDFDQTLTALSDVSTTSNGPIKVVAESGTITANDGADADGLAISAAGSGAVLLEARTAGSHVIANADIVSGAGHVTLIAAAGITVEDDVMTGGAGTVLLNAQSGSITLNDSAGDADVTGVTAVNGDILLTAGTDITLNADISSLGVGSVGVTAANDVSQNGDVSSASGHVLVTAGGHVTMAAGTETTALGNDILYNATGGTIVLALLAATNVSLEAGTNISDGNGGATANIRGDNVRMRAGGRIGDADGAAGLAGNTNAIDMEATTLSAESSAGIWLQELTAGGAITVGEVAAMTVSVNVQQATFDSGLTAVAATDTLTVLEDLTTTADGPIKLVAENGSITVTDGSAADGAGIRSAGAGDVLLEARGAGSDLQLHVDILSGTGHITLLAADDITAEDDIATAGGGSVLLSALAGAIVVNDAVADVDSTGITTGNGDILLSAATSVTLNADLNTTGAGDIGVTAGTDVTQNADVNAGGDILFNAGAGSVSMSSGTTSTAAGGELLVSAATNVNIGLLAATHVSVDSGAAISDANGDATANITATNVRLTAGTLIGDADGGSAAADNLNAVDLNAAIVAASSGTGIYLNEVAAGTDISVGEVSAATVTVNVTQATFDSGTVPVQATSTHTGLEDLTTTTDGPIKLVSQNGSIFVNGGTATPDSGVTAGGAGDVLLEARGTASDVTTNADVVSGTGNVTLAAGRSVEINHDVVTDGAGEIYVQSLTGSITLNDADATTVAVQTTAGEILLSAATAITLDAETVSTSGSIGITAGHGVAQNQAVSTGGGDILLTAAAGSVTQATSSSTSTGAAGGNILVIAAGSISLHSVDAGTGMIHLNAGGDIIDTDASTSTDLTAESLRMTAVGIIGGPDGGAALSTDNATAIDTSVGTLSAAAGTGIYVQEADDVVIGNVAALTVTVVAARADFNSGTTNMTATRMVGQQADLRTTDNGSIKLVAENGTIAAMDGNADGAAVVAHGSGDVLLESRTAGDVLVNAEVQSGNGHITLNAADDVDVNADVTTGGTGTVYVVAGNANASDAAASNVDGINIDAILTTTDGDILFESLRDVQATALVMSTNGDIGLIAANDIRQTATSHITTTGGDVLVDAGNDWMMDGAAAISAGGQEVLGQAGNDIQLGIISLTNVTANRVALTAARDLTDANAGGVNIEETTPGASTELTLRAGSTIGGTDGLNGASVNHNAIDLNVDTVAAIADDGIYLREVAAGGDIVIDTVSGVTVDIDGVMRANFDSTATDVSEVRTVGSLEDLTTTSVASGPVKLVAEEGTITARAGAGGGSVSAAGSGDILLEARTTGDVVVEAAITSGTGHVTFDAADDLSVNATVATSGAGTIYLRSGNGVSGDAVGPEMDGININAAIMSVDGDMLFESAADIRQTANVSTTNGDVGLLAARDIAQTASTSVTTTDGDLLIDAGRDWTMAGDADVSAGGQDLLGQAGRDIILGVVSATDSATNRVALSAGRDLLDANGGSVNIQETVAGSSTEISIRAAGMIGAPDGISGPTVNNNAIDLNGDTVAALAGDGIYLRELAVGDDIRVDSVSSVSVDVDDVVRSNFSSTTLDVSEDRMLASLEDLATTADGPIKLVSEAGDITISAGTAGGGISADGTGDILLEARSGGNIVADADIVSGSGNITLDASNRLNIGSLINPAVQITTAGIGSIVALAGADDLVMTVDARLQSADGSIHTEAAGSIMVGRIQTDADVSVTARGGSITDADPAGDALEDIIADGLRIDSAGTVGEFGVTGNAMETRVTTLASTSGGIVHLTETDDLVVDNVSVTTTRANFNSSITTTTAAALPGIDTSASDLLLTTGGTLSLGQQLNAGTATARIISGETISQTATGVITAAQLGIILDSATPDQNVELGAAPNVIGTLAVRNTSVGGDVTVFDSDLDLTIENVASLLSFATTTGIDTNAGDINITAEGDLTINENIDAAHNSISSSIDEAITLISRRGHFSLADNTIISTDEDPTPGVFDDQTGDRLTIIAGSITGTGNVDLGTDIEVRTDGGVAKQIAPRPTAFVTTPTTGAESAFVTLTVAEDMRSSLSFANGGFLGVLDLFFGVAGEENLEVVIDWGVVSQTLLTDPSGPAGADLLLAGDAIPSTAIVGAFEFTATDADKTIFYIDEGGSQYLIPHSYAIADLATSANDRNGRENNPNIIGVRISVAQHASINIWGDTATDPLTAAIDSPPDFVSTGSVQSVTDATGAVIDLPTADLSLLSSTDTNPLREFSQEAAETPFSPRAPTPTGIPEGLAEWEFIAGPSPGLVLFEPTERPTIDIPLIESPVNDLVFSEISDDVSFGTGAVSEAAVGTDVYLQIRRRYELDADPEIVIARITDKSFIATREGFEEFVADNPELTDGDGYEVWLITETSGQTVERPIVKFEITAGRPGPATEVLPSTFEPYRLKEIEFEQPEADGLPEGTDQDGGTDMSAVPAPPVVPARDQEVVTDAARRMDIPNDSTSSGGGADSAIEVGAGADNTAVTTDEATIDIPKEAAEFIGAAAVPAILSGSVARWRRRRSQNDNRLTRTARAMRKISDERTAEDSTP